MATNVTPEGEKIGVALARWVPVVAKMVPGRTESEQTAVARQMLAAARMCLLNDESGYLERCTVKSIAISAARTAAFGLYPGVTAYLVPFKNKKSGQYEAQCVIGTKGYVQLAAENGTRLSPGVVRDGDEFEYQKGTGAFLRHVPKRGNRAPIVAAYCMLKSRTLPEDFEVMDRDEIEAVRQGYSQKWKTQKLDDLDWYVMKTVTRRAAKYVPCSGAAGRRLAAAMQAEKVEDIPDAEVTPLLEGDVKEIEVPRRAPTHQPLDLSAMTEEIGTVESGSVDVLKAFEGEPDYAF